LSVLRPKYDFVRPADVSPQHLSLDADGRTDVSAPLQRLAYSVAEAAAVSNLSRSKLYELLGSGELHSVKIAGRRLIRHCDLLALLKMGAE
jgi:excisionase family DNA binding protein